LIEFGREQDAEVRFIEYMDVGGATDWSLGKVFSRDSILAALGKRYGKIVSMNEDSSAPADRYCLPDGTVFGIIASTTAPFCRKCDRSRLTADGMWYLCLYAQQGADLRKMLRGGDSHEAIALEIARVWHGRADRGAELRADQPSRGVFVPVEALREDIHLEMHTRGG
jgi:cyclic pyranopterin phosphate synthase